MYFTDQACGTMSGMVGLGGLHAGGTVLRAAKLIAKETRCSRRVSSARSTSFRCIRNSKVQTQFLLKRPPSVALRLLFFVRCSASATRSALSSLLTANCAARYAGEGSREASCCLSGSSHRIRFRFRIPCIPLASFAEPCCEVQVAQDILSRVRTYLMAPLN